MILWESDNEDFFTVNSVASNLVQLENELTETIAKIIELGIFNNDYVEFYSDATNGSFFINELNHNKERIDESKTVHFCALKIWEDYNDSNEFDSDMKTALNHSLKKLASENIRIPFKIVLRDEGGNEIEI